MGIPAVISQSLQAKYILVLPTSGPSCKAHKLTTVTLSLLFFYRWSLKACVFHLTILVLTKASRSTDSYSDTLKKIMTNFTLLNKGLKSKILNCIIGLCYYIILIYLDIPIV